MSPRKVLLAIAIAALAVQPWACKKSPATSTSPTPAGISAAFNPATAGPDAVVGFVITVSATGKEIRSFGGELGFDTNMFSFQEAAKGSLTSSWALVDANESSPGTLRLAGAAGGGTSAAANSSGTLVEVRFKVTGGNYGNGQQNRICLTQFADDLTQFGSTEACATFTLKK